MARKAIQYEFIDGGVTKKQWRVSADPVPTHDAGTNPRIIDTLEESSIEIRQHAKSSNHFQVIPVEFTVGGNTTQYKDIITPDYTKGWDPLSISHYASLATTGDQVVTAKILIGKIGSVASAVTAGATEVTLASSKGILLPMILGGVLDEGFYLSFGVENSTDAELNAGITGDPVNPDEELKEYEIKRIGSEVDAGGGTFTNTITVFGTLPAIAANLDANLVTRWVRSPISLISGQLIKWGSETLKGGNVPANKRTRFGYKNIGGTVLTIRGSLSVLY